MRPSGKEEVDFRSMKWSPLTCLGFTIRSLDFELDLILIVCLMSFLNYTSNDSSLAFLSHEAFLNSLTSSESESLGNGALRVYHLVLLTFGPIVAIAELGQGGIIFVHDLDVDFLVPAELPIDFHFLLKMDASNFFLTLFFAGRTLDLDFPNELELFNY